MNSISFPQVTTAYLRELTDDFGIWQHTKGSEVHAEHGYALDDAARGLLAALQYDEMKVAASCLGFLERACSKEVIYNFFDQYHQPIDHPFSEDAIGEAIWALGYAWSMDYEASRVTALLKVLSTWVERFEFPRAKAYAILGYLYVDRERAGQLLEQLVQNFNRVANSNWIWFEDVLAYGNAILPLALIRGGRELKKEFVLEKGLQAQQFLNRETTENGIANPVGNRGWYMREGEKAHFDQQPIDPAYQVVANVEAYLTVGDQKFRDSAYQNLAWFWGQNSSGLPLINFERASCYDGIGVEGVSHNQGAENIICYLLAQHTYGLLQ